MILQSVQPTWATSVMEDHEAIGQTESFPPAETEPMPRGQGPTHFHAFR